MREHRRTDSRGDCHPADLAESKDLEMASASANAAGWFSVDTTAALGLAFCRDRPIIRQSEENRVRRASESDDKNAAAHPGRYEEREGGKAQTIL